jgi:hypothetical protein
MSVRNFSQRQASDDCLRRVCVVDVQEHHYTLQNILALIHQLPHAQMRNLISQL